MDVSIGVNVPAQQIKQAEVVSETVQLAGAGNGILFATDDGYLELVAFIVFAEGADELRVQFALKHKPSEKLVANIGIDESADPVSLETATGDGIIEIPSETHTHLMMQGAAAADQFRSDMTGSSTQTN